MTSSSPADALIGIGLTAAMLQRLIARPTHAGETPMRVIEIQRDSVCVHDGLHERLAVVPPTIALTLTDDSLAVGRRLEIELFLPDGGSLTVDVRVAWIRKLEQDEFAQYEAGLEFLGVDEAQEKLLERCVMDIKSDPA